MCSGKCWAKHLTARGVHGPILLTSHLFHDVRATLTLTILRRYIPRLSAAKITKSRAEVNRSLCLRLGQ